MKQAIYLHHGVETWYRCRVYDCELFRTGFFRSVRKGKGAEDREDTVGGKSSPSLH